MMSNFDTNHFIFTMQSPHLIFHSWGLDILAQIKFLLLLEVYNSVTGVATKCFQQDNDQQLS